MSHQHHPAKVPTPTPTCEISADAQPTTPQHRRAATNAPTLPPIPPPTHYALMHGASASTPHNVASVAAASVTMNAANAFGLAGAAHAVSAASLAAGSNSTFPLDQFYWICCA